jgi:D-3-phosphoglycerate dehydrogenase / 2-oxoglutarate reductase
LLNGYDICVDDHSYLPTALVERCDRLKHVVFLGTGAASYIDVGELGQHDIRVHTIKGYGDTVVAEHAIALMLTRCRDIARSRANIWSARPRPLATRSAATSTLDIQCAGHRHARRERERAQSAR